ncbi:MAG TPA: GNAT family N-acetyltransferase [Thermoanaerobaculia bacterium]|nr:GNAT family N-acetyltransferase [Thermoanaerobaculia bacterium]
MSREVQISYLEMLSAGDLRPSPLPAGFEVRQARIPAPELNRFFYAAVGRDWHWTDRLEWTEADWLAYLDRPELETWIGYAEGTPAGYFELERQDAGDVELKYFGLLPRFLGRGLGGALLTTAAERAWSLGASRLWLHTNTLDSPAALQNYLARGFRVFRVERKSVL